MLPPFKLKLDCLNAEYEYSGLLLHTNLKSEKLEKEKTISFHI